METFFVLEGKGKEEAEGGRKGEGWEGEQSRRETG